MNRKHQSNITGMQLMTWRNLIFSLETNTYCSEVILTLFLETFKNSHTLRFDLNISGNFKKIKFIFKTLNLRNMLNLTWT